MQPGGDAGSADSSWRGLFSDVQMSDRGDLLVFMDWERLVRE